MQTADQTALDEELGALKARETDDETASRESFAAYREAKRRLDAVGGDDVVARIEEAAHPPGRDQGGGTASSALRAGVTAAADAALRLYRDRHRGAMMSGRQGRFPRSAAACLSRADHRAERAERDAHRARRRRRLEGGEELSKGARFQLYLALRVAGYHELAKVRVPAPFIADDIMETFDHFRAEEALRLFAEMGRVGQVIYFTHHLHLAEIAQRRRCAGA